MEVSDCIPQHGNEWPQDIYLHRHVIPKIASACLQSSNIWQILGLELLGQDGADGLDLIALNYQSKVEQCTQMLKLWRQRQHDASWVQLIEALKRVKLFRLAKKIEEGLKPNMEQDKVAASMQVTKELRKEPSKSCGLLDFAEYPDVSVAFSITMSILQKEMDDTKCFKFVNTACKVLATNPALKKKIEETQNLEGLFQLLTDNEECCNWINIRFLVVIAKASGNNELVNLLKSFSHTYHSKTLKELLDNIPFNAVKAKQYNGIQASLGGKDPDNVVVTELIKKCPSSMIKDIATGMGCTKEGSLSFIPTDEVHHTYFSVLMLPHESRMHSHLQIIGDWIVHNPMLVLQNLRKEYPAISSSTLLIGYYHGLLLKYMDANFLIEKMRSTNLLTTSKEEMILTGHSAHQRSRLLLEHVQQMGTKDLLVFCDFVEQNIPEVGSQLIKALQFIDTTGAHSCTHQEVEIINASSLHIMFLKVIDQIEEQLQLHDSSLLIEKCKSLMASETHKISLFSKKFIDTLGKCDDAFKYLSFLFTWSNHSILRALTSSNIEAIDLLDRFDSLLDCSKHILSYPIPSFSQNMLPFDTSEYTLLAVKFEKELWECPLQYVLDIESFIIKAYDLTQYCLQLLAVKCDGPTAFYWTIPKCIQELISQHPEYLQQGTLELEVYSKATDSDIIKGSDDRIAEGSNGSIAKQSSAFTTSKPTVDDSSRASEHEQKSVLQVDLLKNFNLFTSKHSKAPRICLFLVSPKKRSKDKKVIDFHYFVRICVPELNKKATPELFEMQFKEGLHQLELAFYDRRSPSTYNNHIFLNFCVVLTMDPKQMQAKISHLVSLCKLKLAELRVTEIEIKASIKFAYEERCMRIFISPSGNTDLYFEVENRTTGEVIFQTCGPQKGPYDGLNVDWPYFRPKKSETMIPNSEYEALKQEKKHLADELSCANSKVLQQESEIKLQNSQIETLRKERQQAFSKYCDQIFLKQKIMNLINELESVKAKNKHLTDKYSMAVSDSKLKRYNRQYSDNQLEALKNEIKPPNSEVMVELIALNKEKKQIIDEQIKQSSLIDELESEIMMLKYKLEASRKEYKQLIVKYNTLKSERNKTSVAIQTDEIQFQVSGLPQDDAVKVLENNSLHMNKFIYKYLWEKLEGEDIRKKNEIIEEMITQELHNDYNLQQSLMVQYKLPTVANCNVLVYLLRECKLPLEICLDVAKMNDDIQKAESLLTQECLICCDLYLINKMVKMINCDHAVCHNCFVGYFSVMITEKSIKHYNCPLCGEPDITSEAIHFDFYLQLFGELMQKHMKKEQYEMSVQKINEHKMMKDPNFRWCTKCSTGFINEAGTKKIQCPNPTCGETMCFFCKKPWEEQHINLTCEDFAAWKKDNDPKLQEQGLAAYLNERGIECPSCGFKYAVVGGGHMHFRCAHCPAEFCIGCNNLFRKAKHCIEYESCYKKGIHAHHPRDCLFFLRDESVENLQKLLQVNNVEFDTESPEEQNIKEIALWGPQTSVAPLAAAGAAPTPVMKCNVMLQKENPNGPPVDEKCSFAVQSGHAGLCLKHYKVYLVFKINQNHIDPLPLFKISQLKGILDRDEVKVPNQLPGEGEPEYTERLRQIIKKKIPLVEGKGNHC